jgi:flavorubredoxin
MNAIILYDTKYGNTEIIAKAIGNGMTEEGFDEVVIQNGGKTTHDELLEKDIWIFGSPTHKGTTSSHFKKLLKWVRADTIPDTRGFAFETRLGDSEGGAAQVIQHAMAGSGIVLIHETTSFVVEAKQGPLSPGEEERAFSLGREIADRFREEEES